MANLFEPPRYIAIEGPIRVGKSTLTRIVSDRMNKKRLRKKNAPSERAISDDYIEEVAKAYEHFFFHYTASDLLVVNTSDIDFVDRNEDLQQLLRRLSEPIHGTQYFLPLGSEAASA